MEIATTEMNSCSAGFAKRFWRGICIKLADRLTNLHSKGSSGGNLKDSTGSTTDEEDKTPTSSPSPSRVKRVTSSFGNEASDEEYRRKFDLSNPGEILLKSESFDYAIPLTFFFSLQSYLGRKIKSVGDTLCV